jgi:hypothetical protein
VSFSSCPTGKRQYADVRAAKRALDLLMERWTNGTIADPCFAKRGYLCPDCDQYHLTKKDAWRYNATDVHIDR